MQSVHITCDKCGEITSVTNNTNIEIKSSFSVFRSADETFAPSTQKIDLCPKCYSEFIYWLDMAGLAGNEYYEEQYAKFKKKNGIE